MILDDIERAKEKIDSLKDAKISTIEEYFLKIYCMSTENSTGYLRGLNYKDKDILTTGSSGDQTLNFIFYGAKNIDFFDINPFIKYYFELKKSGIFNLNRKDYLDFFNYDKLFNSKKLFDENTYYRLSKDLEFEAKLFWDTLYSLYKPNEIKERLFFINTLSKEKAIRNNPYLSEDNFLTLRKKIEKTNINFINSNLTNLSLNAKKYDYVLLSNIFDYLFNFFVNTKDVKLEEKLCNYVNYVNKLTNLLTDDGIMFFHYFWDSDINLLLHKIIRLFYNNKQVSTISFPNYNLGGNYLDTVMMYRKTLKK